MLRHVMQRRRNDCVIATAAIVATVPYPVAAQHSSVQLGKRGLRPNEVLRLLRQTTGVDWQNLSIWMVWDTAANCGDQ